MSRKIRAFALGMTFLFATAASAVPACTGAQHPKTFYPCEVTANGLTDAVNNNYYTHFSDVTATFKHTATGRQITIRGFYDGGTLFRFRFTPTKSGGWTYSLSSTPADNGLTLVQSSEFIVDADPTARGFLRRDTNDVNNPNASHTAIWDNDVDNNPGTQHPFIWGQTYYQMISNFSDPQHSANSWRTAYMQSMNKGFNKFRVLLYPWWGGGGYGYADTQPFELQSGQGPEKPDHNKLRFVHWQNFDQMLEELVQHKAIVEIILFHDQALNTPDQTNNVVSRAFGTVVTKVGNAYTYTDTTVDERYAKYAVARYGAFPNVYFCLSNEWGATHLDAAFWRKIGAAVRSADPYFQDPDNGRFRLLSIHDNTSKLFTPFTTFADRAENGGWVTHAVQQYSFRNDEGNLIADSWANSGIIANLGLGMPVFNDEFGYINDKSNQFGPLRDPEHRAAMWGIAVAGGFGTVGDVTKGGPNNAAVSLTADWIDHSNLPSNGEYTSVANLVNLFRNTTLRDAWWKMSGNNTYVSNVPNNDSTRSYALVGAGQYLAYVVQNSQSTAAKKRLFRIHLPVGYYNTTFYNPRTQGTQNGPGQVTCPRRQNCTTNPLVATQLKTPTLDDWALRVVPSTTFSGSPDEVVWVSDTLPDGAATFGDYESWNWIDEDPVPISDSFAHQSNSVAGVHQHYFTGAAETLTVSAGNVLYTQVYLDPGSTPNEVMLQWNDGTWEHRAYWGANLLPWGVNGTNSRRYMGPLPAPGQWVRLQVPAGDVGLEGHTLNGMAFSLYGGKATWDNAGKTGQSVPVCDPGVIVQEPQDQTIIPGDSATLSVAVTGTGTFNYQFYQSPVGTYQNPTGISTATINTGPLTTTKQYWAEINDTCMGTFLASRQATVTVQCTAAPYITVEPTSRVTNPGQSTTLSVSATQAVSIQWYQGTSGSTANLIPNATFPTLTVAPQSTTNYWVRISNGCGNDDSQTATVCVLPSITANPTPRTINPGQSTTLTVSAINAATYQWYVGTAPSTATPIGGNSNSLSVSPTVTTNYWVRVTNSCGIADSTTVTVTVAPPPPKLITRIQSASTLANSQTSITANWTQPTQPGTFLVAVISGVVDVNPYINWTPPAGWQHAVTSEWTNVKLSIYYLPNNAGARASETFGVSPGFHDMSLYILEYSGITTANPLDKTGVAGSDTNNGYVQTGFTANTTQANELVITALTTYTQTEFSTTPADGYTELYDQYMLYHLTTAMYEKVATSIGSYGHGATVYVPAQWVGLVATFKATNTN